MNNCYAIANLKKLCMLKSAFLVSSAFEPQLQRCCLEVEIILGILVFRILVHYPFNLIPSVA